MTESPRSRRRTPSRSASVSSSVPGVRATRGKTVLTTHRVYARFVGFVRRNVAVKRPTQPRPAITFPMTASMYFLTGTNAVGRPLVPELMIALRGARVQFQSRLPGILVGDGSHVRV